MREPQRTTRRDMLPDEFTVAMALGRVRFQPASYDKAFARIMHAEALAPPGRITARQSRYLFRVGWRYRRQLTADVVDTVRRNGGDAE